MRAASAFLAIILVTVFCVGVNAQEALQVNKPRPPMIGDFDEYVGHYSSMDCTRWTVRQVDEFGKAVVQCGNMLLYRDESGNFVKVTGDGGKILWEFKPFLPSLQFPLFIGKKWSGDYVYFRADANRRSPGDKTCVVAAFEKVRVPAGLFDAFRIECTDKAEITYFIKLQVHRTTWYSPLLGKFVKSIGEDHTWDWELANYGTK